MRATQWSANPRARQMGDDLHQPKLMHLSGRPLEVGAVSGERGRDDSHTLEVSPCGKALLAAE